MILRLYHELLQAVIDNKEKPSKELEEKIEEIKKRIQELLDTDYHFDL